MLRFLRTLSNINPFSLVMLDFYLFRSPHPQGLFFSFLKFGKLSFEENIQSPFMINEGFSCFEYTAYFRRQSSI